MEYTQCIEYIGYTMLGLLLIRSLPCFIVSASELHRNFYKGTTGMLCDKFAGNTTKAVASTKLWLDLGPAPRT